MGPASSLLSSEGKTEVAVVEVDAKEESPSSKVELRDFGEDEDGGSLRFLFFRANFTAAAVLTVFLGFLRLSPGQTVCWEMR